jgi:hypothetical protein
MKTSEWIKLIGILCIFFGGQGIINDIIPLLFPEMIGWVKEKLPELSSGTMIWVLILPYITLLANLFYLMAGIFFLMKKTYSLKIMYIALTFSILCRIVPMLFFSQNSSTPLPNYEINIFSLLGPCIDVLLLIGVSILAKYYYKSQDELIKLFREYTMTRSQLKLLTFFGLVCVSIPISIQGLWIYSTSSYNNQADRVATFNSYFPILLHGRYTLNYFSIAFCIFAITISIINLKSSNTIWKVNMITLVLGGLLLLLNLFQMM